MREQRAVIRELVALLETRLVDSIRHVDGVTLPVSVVSHIEGRLFEGLP